MWSGRTALITGATAGLGWEFAQQLAARGVHLCLVGRRLSLLQQHAADLSARYGVRSEVIALD
ncbi:MAG: SDR family NAD(P)-dependent oxidoreductase, partial [Pseudomonadales bacterium]|nr:SDR family NAD(P)-dependent oxidoreductase [Pseudomonadales bacterium]